MAKSDQTMQTLILGFIRLYRLLLSPFLGQNCRFEPTCSRYAEQAVREHGAIKGSALAVKRIGRCHPWNPGGYDPVPPAENDKNSRP